MSVQMDESAKTENITFQLGVACVSNAAKLLESISQDPEMSIPDVVITMNDGKHLLAYAKVRVNEVKKIAKYCG